MSPEEPGVRFGRHSDTVHRWLRGKVLVMRRDGRSATLDGSAALVWMVLDVPGTAIEIDERIADLWPTLDTIDPDQVGEALEVLVAESLVLADEGTKAT